jgi:hypothetical protein
MRARLTTNGFIQYEALVHIWIDADVVFVDHRHPLRFDHVLLVAFVTLVEDEAVALGCKCDEYDSVEERFEFVASAADSEPLIWPFLRVNRWFMKVNNTVGVAVRSRGLTYFLVQKCSDPACDTRSKVRVHVMSSLPFFFQVFVPALE